jgi:hypothetical protein
LTRCYSLNIIVIGVRIAEIPVTPATQRLFDTAMEYLACDLAASTSAEYKEHFKYWVRFCYLFGMAACMFCPSEIAVLLYVTFLAASVNPRTIGTYLSGLKHSLVQGRFLAPGVWESWLLLPRVLQGIKRKMSSLVNRKLAITPIMLRAMCAFIPSTADAICVWAAMLVCFYGFLRKSHVCVGGNTILVPHLLLKRRDVHIDLSRYCIVLSLRFAKTNQYGDHVHEVVIKGVPGCVLDPVRWLALYFKMVPASLDSPCFVLPTPHGGLQPLTYALLVQSMKRWLAQAGFNPDAYSGHSLRRGGATAAFHAGVDPLFIRLQGDWSSDAWLLYVSLSHAQKCRITESMQQHMMQQQ